MAQTLRRLVALAAALPLGLVWLLPFALAMVSLAFSVTWADMQAFWETPHVVVEASLSISIGTVSTLAAAAIALWLAISLPVKRQKSLMGSYLAVPHLAFAIGLTFLIMPAGLLPRLFFDAPPQWVTVQDPYGLGLMVTLVLKEVPFLLWLMYAALNREDFSRTLEAQRRVSLSLGHGSWSTAWRITAPQLLEQIAWPLLIVWVYGCSVVDMALIIGPTQPSPAQLAIWHDLNDADTTINGRGLAGVFVLTALLAIVAGAFAAGWRMTVMLRRRWLIRGPNQRELSGWSANIVEAGFGIIYALVFMVLLMLSFTQRWPFPALLPESLWFTAWSHVVAEPSPLITSIGFALGTSLLSLVLALCWFEYWPRRSDKVVAAAALLALTLPAVALAAGQYQFMLQLGLNGTAAGVFLAQFVPVFGYAFLTLVGPYRAFDERYRSAAHGLNSSDWRFLTRVKWPLLKRPLASSTSIGFAVSMAQYIPVQLVGAGNWPTLTTEAVTLASGGNRAVLAAYALTLTLLVAAAFALCGWIGARRDA